MTFDPLTARAAILHGFPNLRVLVVGDVMLDRYQWGTVERISPEAPVPVVHLIRESSSLGGAANVASNLMHLGSRTEMAGLVGDDADGRELVEACRRFRIGTEALVAELGFATTTKTRVFASHQQMLRIDREAATAPGASEGLLGRVQTLLDKGRFDAVIISDYAKGVCRPELCRGLIQACKAEAIPVYVDPKGVDYDKYRGATAITPNKAEMRLVVQRLGWPDEDLALCADRLRTHLDLEFVAVTLGADGILLVDKEETHLLPAKARDVFDVSGAGDTVIATMVLAIAAGLPTKEAVALSNMAAAIVVAQIGSTPIRKDDLLLAIQGKGHEGRRKHFSAEDLPALLRAWRSEGDRVVLTNGCFDLLHAGHIQFLEEAAQLGDRLVVALNSDESVSRVKGAGRPVLAEPQRVALLSALEAVDAIVVYGGDLPDEIIETVRPDLLVKGGDHDLASIAGASFVIGYGGQVRTIPILQGLITGRFAAVLE